MSLHLLGIRHHGPGSARSVIRALDDIAPDAVLVELPADVDGALRWVGEPGLDPPVALLGYVVAEPVRAAFAPLATFSPEWQAILWANRHDVPVVPIDLPLATTLAGAGLDGDADEATMFDATAPPDPLRDLAAAAGDPDPERWWEDVIEHRGDGAPAFDAVAEAMTEARRDVITGRRELQREAHMRRCIRAAQRAGHTTIAVVCGAWHVPALDLTGDLSRALPGDDSGGPAGERARDPSRHPSHHPSREPSREPGAPAVPTATADAATLRGLPRVKTAVAWVPWTHRRLTAASGYGAGTDRPGWYRHVFDHPGPDGVARFFVDAARLIRAHGGAASPDELIAGTRLADSLAAMRARPRAGLAEVLDAADAVMGGLDLVRRELVIGDEIGAVPSTAPQVPLARDVARAQKSARLAPRAEPHTVEIDLRTPTGRRKSQLLHRLLALGVAWGSVVEGRGTSGTFRETWELRWQPELAVRLIERAGYGTTIEAASTARLLERARASSAIVELVGVIELALYAELPDAVRPSVLQLASLAATDPDIGHLLDALPALSSALRYGDARGTDAAALGDVVDGMVVRVLAGLSTVARNLGDDAATMLVERLGGLQAALATLDHPARQREFPRVLVDLTAGSGHGLVQGRATRLLHDGGWWSVEAVERRLSRALSGGTPPAAGAAFVEGFLAGSGSVLVHDVELLGVLDGWVSSLSPDGFDAVVPLLRRTFGAFEAAERRQLMSMIVEVDLGSRGGFGDDVDPDRAAAVVQTVRRMLGLAAEEMPA